MDHGPKHPGLHVIEGEQEATNFGGLSLVTTIARKLGIPKIINKTVSIFQQHRPYTESNHVLSLCYSIFLGGSAIEDVSILQGSEPVKKILGATRLPDPTTCGDFLGRFKAESLGHLALAVDEIQAVAWKKGFKKKGHLACIDVDSHVHAVYGNQREGADLSYKGTFGFHPLIVTLEQTGELSLVNRPGNATSAEGVEIELERHVPRVKEHFRTVVVRGDSAFFSGEVMATCEDLGAKFTFSTPCNESMINLAEGISDSHWRPFKSSNRPKSKTGTKRRKGKNLRRETLRKRGKRGIKRTHEWVAETEYSRGDEEEPLRLIVRKVELEEHPKQEKGKRLKPIGIRYEYQFIVTNLSTKYTPKAVVDLHYRRCNQENIIEQITSGALAMRYPAREFRANSAYLQCARLAQNLKCWVALLLLPPEVIHWEWKRFRLHFVYLAARVTRHARQVTVTLIGELRFGDWIMNAFTA